MGRLTSSPPLRRGTDKWYRFPTLGMGNLRTAQRRCTSSLRSGPWSPKPGPGHLLDFIVIAVGGQWQPKGGMESSFEKRSVCFKDDVNVLGQSPSIRAQGLYAALARFQRIPSLSGYCGRLLALGFRDLKELSTFDHKETYRRPSRSCSTLAAIYPARHQAVVKPGGYLAVNAGTRRPADEGLLRLCRSRVI